MTSRGYESSTKEIVQNLGWLENIQAQYMTLFEAAVDSQPIHPPPEPVESVQFKERKQGADWKKISRESKYQEEQEFNRQDFIQRYQDEKWKAELHNRDSILWLINCRENMKGLTTVQLHAIQIKIDQFLNVIGDQQSVYPSLRLDLDALKVKRSPPAQADWNE